MTHMKLLLFATCLWHTTITHPGRTPYVVDLVNQPKLGQPIHINGEIWRITETKHVCGAH